MSDALRSDAVTSSEVGATTTSVIAGHAQSATPGFAPEASTVLAPPRSVRSALRSVVPPLRSVVPPLRSVVPPLRHVGARLVYWTPVFAALILFAQVAFLGLRPALSEARRLAAASDMLEARWSHDRGLYDAYELQLRVRQDPIFVERQRRLRRSVPARVTSGV